MKYRALIPWLIAGGLVASTLWNVQLLSQLERVEAKSPTASTETLPARVVSRLSLSAEQCEAIRCCGVT
ncbi:MAG: hypothetical protein ACYTGW_05455 [Planctomycetota bacterium]|jgi:hypothetical protein